MQNLIISPITIEHLNQYGAIYATAFSGEPWNDNWSVEDATINLGEVFTVEQILTEHPDCSVKQVVFNVFKDIDWDIYQRLLL